jgi:hypothetical protein
MSTEGEVGGLLAGTSTLRVVAARAVPTLVMRAAVPAVLFLVGRNEWGLAGGVFLTLAWGLSVQVIRRLRRLPLSTILLLGMAELAIRSSAALALNSTRAYFITPAVLTALIGAVFVASAFTSKPLVARVLWEIVPESVLHPDDPRTESLLRRASILYGAYHVTVAAASIAMLLSMSTTAYVAVHPALTWVALALAALVAIPMWRRHTAGAGASVSGIGVSGTGGPGVGAEGDLPVLPGEPALAAIA